jgi:hypothetical protein
MNRQFIVKDETLQSVGYELTKKTLEVEFCGGDVYAYDGVSYPVFRSLMSAHSRNKYFQNHIRDLYPHRKIEAISVTSLMAA